jgi:hypothetical protein
MPARAALLRRGTPEARERETSEQTIRRLGAETPEQTRIRLGLEAAKQRRRRIGLRALAGAVGVALLFLFQVLEGGHWMWQVWHLSRASWYHRGLIAVGGILVVLAAVSRYRRRGVAT